MSRFSERAKGYEEGATATARPAFVTDEMLVFLDELRESGTTNMFGARPYLMEEFGLLTEKEASACLGYWMKTFGQPTR